MLAEYVSSCCKTTQRTIVSKHYWNQAVCNLKLSPSNIKGMILTIRTVTVHPSINVLMNHQRLSRTKRGLVIGKAARGWDDVAINNDVEMDKKALSMRHARHFRSLPSLTWPTMGARSLMACCTSLSSALSRTLSTWSLQQSNTSTALTFTSVYSHHSHLHQHWPRVWSGCWPCSHYATTTWPTCLLNLPLYCIHSRYRLIELRLVPTCTSHALYPYRYTFHTSIAPERASFCNCTQCIVSASLPCATLQLTYWTFTFYL